jgi:hypothetical protein
MGEGESLGAVEGLAASETDCKEVSCESIDPNPNGLPEIDTQLETSRWPSYAGVQPITLIHSSAIG